MMLCQDSRREYAGSQGVMMEVRLLEGVKVAEVALFETGGAGTVLADLGADVVKIERPGVGDQVRRTAWPFVNGESIMFKHLGRGKRSVAVDIQQPRGAAIVRQVMLAADVVIEGMRPGVLSRYGLDQESLRAEKPALVWCTITGYGMDGPYANLGAHGIGFDAWAGIMDVQTTADGFTTGALRVPLGTRVAPLLASSAILAGVLRAKTSGVGCAFDIAQSEAALSVDWLTVEGHQAHRRPESEVTGNPNDGGARREPGMAAMGESVRYQVYPSRDGHIVFMATEKKFWRNFCMAVGLEGLLRDIDSEAATSHAVGDHNLRRELTRVFAERTTAEWVQLGLTADFPLAPVNDARTIADDPQFLARLGWLPEAEYGADLIPLPVHLVGDTLAAPSPSPQLGQHTDEVLRELGVTDVDDLREARVIG